MLACRMAVLPRDRRDDLQHGLLRWLGLALVLSTLASFGILLSRTLELNGGVWASLFPDMRLALAVTHFGDVWWWRVPALAVLWAGWTWQSRGRHRAWIDASMLLAVAAIALTRSETGHPADHGDFTLAVWIDWLHMLAAGAWVGSLFGMSLAAFPKLLRAGEGASARSAGIFRRLSALSGAALAVLLACGIYNAVAQIDGFTGLWTTRYGLILDAKLALVLVMIAIGAHNRYVKLPRLLTHAGLPTRPLFPARRLQGRAQTATRSANDVLRSCARAVLAESLLGLAVIGATGVLLHAMPPADAPPMQSSAAAAPSDPIRIAGLHSPRLPSIVRPARQ